jgi:putative Holliday junction resolvase
VREPYQLLKTRFPIKETHLIDERFTSKMARDVMIKGGMKKKERSKKGNVDKISATLILQSFLDRRIG